MNLAIDKIQPYPRNAKKHSQQQIDLISKSISEFGFRQPVVIDKNKEIIIGHARLEAAKQLGMKEVPVIDASDLSLQQVRALRLADNKLAELAQWDMDLAIEELRGLSDDLVDLTGFDRDLLIEGSEKDDVLPENPPAKAKRGDIWQLGKHRVMCGDATKKEDVERLMDGKKADMVFTDPPYGVKIVNTKGNIGFGGELGFVGAKGIVDVNLYHRIIGDENTETAKKHYLLCEELKIKKIIIWGGELYDRFFNSYFGMDCMG